MTKINNKTTGVIAMVITAFLWSLAGLFIKVIDWNPFAIAGIRSLIASIVILIFLKRPNFHLSFSQIAAGFANAATMLLFVTANKTTTAANAILIQYMAPIFTAVLGATMLKERARVEHWVAFLFTAVGMVIMFMDKLDSGKLLGNILALISALTFSLFFVFMRKQKEGSPVESVLISHWITTIICIIVSLFLPLPHFTLKSIAAIMVLGVFQLGITSLLFSYVIRRITAVSANLIAIIEPVFNPVWVFVAIGELPGIHTLIGGGIIVAAVTTVSVISARRRTIVPKLVPTQSVVD